MRNLDRVIVGERGVALLLDACQSTSSTNLVVVVQLRSLRLRAWPAAVRNDVERCRPSVDGLHWHFLSNIGCATNSNAGTSLTLDVIATGMRRWPRAFVHLHESIVGIYRTSLLAVECTKRKILRHPIIELEQDSSATVSCLFSSLKANTAIRMRVVMVRVALDSIEYVLLRECTARTLKSSYNALHLSVKVAPSVVSDTGECGIALIHRQ